MMKWRVKQSHIDDFLVLLMFCISGNPAFNFTEPLGKLVFGLYLLVLLLAFRFRIKKSVLARSVAWMLFLAIIFVAQYLQFRYITVPGSLNFAVKLLCAILLADYLGERLPVPALRVMTLVCVISLLFYLINLTGVRFHSPIKITTRGESLIFYTQTWEEAFGKGIYRNSGMFWEPGAFAGYIIATLLLFVDKTELLRTRYKIPFILLSISLLTTTSTTGYITYALLLLYFIIQWGRQQKRSVYAWLAAGVVFAGAVFAYLNVDFLGKKIRKEFQIAEMLTEEDQINVSRAGSFVFDLQYISSHPLFGNGLAGATRFRYHLGTFDEEDLNGFSNGFSGCIASMGLLFMIAYLLAIGLNHTLRTKWVVILLVILLLQGEYFLNYPFFLMFPFIHFGSPIPDRWQKKVKKRLVWNRKHS